MNYTKEQLEEIEKYASIFLPISDMAVILDIPAEILREDIKDSSILIISHQERILNIADEIIVIKGGIVEKQGSREEVYPHLMRNEVSALCEGPFVPAGKGDAEC